VINFIHQKEAQGTLHSIYPVQEFIMLNLPDIQMRYETLREFYISIFGKISKVRRKKLKKSTRSFVC